MKMIDFLGKYEIFSNKQKLNFFQIAGFPRYEVVFSNVLAFLIENEQLIYHSLLDCLKITSYDKVEEVIREDRTDENKRIDLTIKATDRIIGIENKIGAGLYNDTENYYQHLKGISDDENKELICVILSQKKIANMPDNFVNVLHSDLVKSIKKRDRELANTEYVQILNEFVENILYLQRGTMMAKKFAELLDNKTYREKIENIIENYNLFRKELENKAKEMLSELNIDKLFEKKWPYKDVNDIGYFTIVVVIENFLAVKKYRITIDIFINYKNFEIKIYDIKKSKDDTEFRNIIKKILPDFNENYTKDEEKSICYAHDLNDYNMALDKVKEILAYFKNYKKQKPGS
jgi:hypothetical protein